MAGTMSAKADSSADERADMERINAGNGNVREIQKARRRGHCKLPPLMKCLSPLSHGGNLSCLLSGDVDWQQRSRKGGGNGGCEQARQKALSPWVMLLLWAHSGEAGNCTYQTPISVLLSDLSSRQAQIYL